MPFSSLENLQNRSAMRRDKPKADPTHHGSASCETPRMSPPPDPDRSAHAHRHARTRLKANEGFGTSSTTVDTQNPNPEAPHGTAGRRAPSPAGRDVQPRRPDRRRPEPLHTVQDPRKTQRRPLAQTLLSLPHSRKCPAVTCRRDIQSSNDPPSNHDHKPPSRSDPAQPESVEPARGARAGGAGRSRTDDLLRAKQALSQLSYGPVHAIAPAASALSGSAGLCHVSCVMVAPGAWWAWVDSNYRPHAYQACALTD